MYRIYTCIIHVIPVFALYLYYNWETCILHVFYTCITSIWKHVQYNKKYHTYITHLCWTYGLFEWNLHTQNFTIVSTTFFWRLPLWAWLLCSMTHYDITLGTDVASDVHCDITMSNGIATSLFYYVLLCPIM